MRIAPVELAGPMGFEPTTSDVTGRRSNRAELRPRREHLFYRFRLGYTTTLPASGWMNREMVAANWLKAPLLYNRYSESELAGAVDFSLF